MEKQNSRRTFSTVSLRDLCLLQVVEEFDLYSPEELSLLPPVQRKELLLFCPIVSLCHLEQTCAFDGIDSGTFWEDLLFSHKRCLYCYDVNACDALSVSYSSSREKYFTFLTSMIFGGDRFSGHYAFFSDRNGYMRHFYDGYTPPPEECKAPIDIINFLVAYQKPCVKIEETVSEEPCVEENVETAPIPDKGRVSEEDEEEEEEEDSFVEFYYPLPTRDVFRMLRTRHYIEATKGQHVHPRYSQYVTEENHYRLSEENAISLMMNECNFYPKKLYIHDFDYMHREWSHEDLTRLLTQFFSQLESLDLFFKTRKDIHFYTDNTDDGFREFSLEEVLSCCFSSSLLESITIGGPVGSDTAASILSSTLASKPVPSLRMLDVFCCGSYCSASRFLQAFANVVSDFSRRQLAEVHLRLDGPLQVDVGTFSHLYTSLAGLVQMPQFSKLTMVGQVAFSHLQFLLDIFLRTPCTQPQQINLCRVEAVSNKDSPICIPTGDNKVPSGALEYKSFFVDDCSKVPQDFCEWLFSHQPLALKAFNLAITAVNLPIHLLSTNALFQTKELSLQIPRCDSFYQLLHKLLLHQQLTKLSLVPAVPYTGPCNINDIARVLSIQKEQLTELKISKQYIYFDSFESSTNMEHFGDALYSLRNCEAFSLEISIAWKEEDMKHIDSLYESWLRHGRKRLKKFQMGMCHGRPLPEELSRKLDEMGLVICRYPGNSTRWGLLQ